MDRIVAVIGALAMTAGLLGLAGCTKSPSAVSAAPPPAAAAAQDAAPPEHESWEVYRMQGKRIGYGNATVRRTVEGGQSVVLTESVSHLAVKRAGQLTEEDIRGQSTETLEGRLLRFTSDLRIGPTPIRTTGRVHGDRLDVESRDASTGSAAQSSIAWPADGRGPLAMEQTLWQRPMRPGEQRELTTLMIGFNQAAKVEMVAKDYEPTPLLNGNYDLLRIETVTHLADGQKIDGTVWTNRTGEVQKTFSQAMALETFRVSKAEALKTAGGAELELLPSMLVKVSQPLPRAHRTKEVRYRVHLDGGDPAAAFVTGPTQAVKSIDAHTAEITVYAIRPGQTGGNAAAPHDPPSEDDLRPNNFIQSNDRLIVADAEKAAQGKSDPWQVAVALESYVDREVKDKNLTQAFATAAEVARSREGDCTEHAVFLAALCRARGIPARVAIGLVYMQGEGAFGYHMWTEAYIDHRWIPIDATLAQGGIGAGHLQIAHTNLKGASAYSAFLPVVQILGRLRIEIVEAK
jgi:hypothetical protein